MTNLLCHLERLTHWSLTRKARNQMASNSLLQERRVGLTIQFAKLSSLPPSSVLQCSGEEKLQKTSQLGGSGALSNLYNKSNRAKRATPEALLRQDFRLLWRHVERRPGNARTPE